VLGFILGYMMNVKLKLKSLESSERPREKLINLGADNLTDVELLAIIIRAGGNDNSVLELSRALISSFKGLRGLVNTDINQLTSFKNIGLAKATSIKAACEIGLRISMKLHENKYEIKKPEDVFKFMRKCFYEKDKEYLYLISLDTRSKVISRNLISIGTINETLVHPREVFRQALINNATSIILVHNHPSGDATPSDDDLSITERLYKAGINMGIAVVDHIIMSNDSYVSIKAFNMHRKEVNK